MAELTINADDVRNALNEFAASYEPGNAERVEVGRVVSASDGIARVEGLPSVMANELLRFEDGTLGLAQNLDTRNIGVIVLGDFTGIEEGQVVHRTGEVLSVPVGDAYLGRVVDPLGNPIDDLGPIESEGRRALELQAPGVTQRKSVHEPLQTGLKAIDSMIPIGRGQRQLIIGDRQTGKTAIAIDTILNQKDNWASGDPNKQVRCIYVAVGQKASTIAAVRHTLETRGALEYTTIVASPASDAAGFKYLAPYTGSAIGQHWMYGGKHVLIIFDDLSKQAEAYRAVSLLLRRPPGREAYPGDVFYLHSRLLERCAKLSDDLGAGSMTGFPIIETKANDVSAFIPTKAQLTRGSRLTELLRQPQYTPYAVEEQVVSIWAGTNGYLDDIEVSDVLRFEEGFIEYLRHKTSVLTDIASSGKLEDDTVAALKTAVAEFKQGFQSEGSSHLVDAGHEEHEAARDSDITQETIG